MAELRAAIEELKRALREQKPMQAINLRTELRGLEMVITDTQVNHTKPTALNPKLRGLEMVITDTQVNHTKPTTLNPKPCTEVNHTKPAALNPKPCTEVNRTG